MTHGISINCCYAECHYAESPNVECHYAECRGSNQIPHPELQCLKELQTDEYESVTW